MRLGDLVDHGLAIAGADAVAIGDGRVRLTWSEYRERVSQLAAQLRRAGVAPGDRVAVHLPKSVDSFVSVHAILRAGAVMVPLDWFASAEFLRGVVDDAEPVALVSRARPNVIDEIVSGSTVGVVVDPTAEPDAGGPAVDRGPAVVPVERDAPAYIIYTSGSTGRPKGIVHTHHSAMAYAELAVETYGLTHTDRLANIAPLQFDQSTFELYAAPLAGASVLVVPDGVMKFPASLAKLVADDQVSVWYSVPYALRQLVERGLTGELQLSELRWILYGGEVYPPEELRALMRAVPSARVSNVYGPAEVNQCTFHHLDEPPTSDSPVPIGRAWSGADVELVADDRRIDGVGVGELWVASDTMMDRYWRGPDLTEQAVVTDHRVLGPGRWYRTGDLAERRDDGELVFLGRVDNQIKVRGYRIELEAVEAAFIDATGVDGCAAVVDTDGEQIVAMIDPVLDSDAVAELRTAVRRRLPNHAVPGRIVAVERLPRTSTGKVDRGAARRLLAEQHGIPPTQ